MQRLLRLKMPEKGIEIRKLVGRNEKADWVCAGKN